MSSKESPVTQIGQTYSLLGQQMELLKQEPAVKDEIIKNLTEQVAARDGKTSVSPHWATFSFGTTYTPGGAYTEMQRLINSDTHLVGYAYNIARDGGVFSKNADNFYLETRHGQNNHTIWQDAKMMSNGKAWLDQTPEMRNSGAVLLGCMAGPAIGIKESNYLSIVDNVRFGESNGAVGMYWLYLLKTGQILRLESDPSR